MLVVAFGGVMLPAIELAAEDFVSPNQVLIGARRHGATDVHNLLNYFKVHDSPFPKRNWSGRAEYAFLEYGTNGHGRSSFHFILAASRTACHALWAETMCGLSIGCPS
jgi:hypothetical protein